MASFIKSLPEGWQNRTVLGLSVLLVVSPWLFGFSDLAGAKWDALIVAPVFFLGAGAVLLWEPYWPDFIAAFMAFWLTLSPRILAFTDRLTPTIITLVIGVSVMVLALWSAAVRARSKIPAS